MAIELSDSVQFLKGVGPTRAEDLARLGVLTVEDLLLTFPRDIRDRRVVSTIADAPEGAEVSLIVKPGHIRQRHPRGGRLRSILSVQFTDATGVMEAVWFNAPWALADYAGGEVLLCGKAKREDGRLKLDHPQYELLGAGGLEDSLNAGRLVPVYPCTGSLTQKIWRKIMAGALDSALQLLPEILPPELSAAHAWPSRREAVRAMHFPPHPEARENAQASLVFEECLVLQLAVLIARRKAWESAPGRALTAGPAVHERIRRLLPFKLTAAQERVIAEILADLAAPQPMHRLLQGDVGSGKTIVAAYAMLAAVAAGVQVCLMAPTSLLARQHYDTLAALLARSSHSRVQVGLLTGGSTAGDSQALKTRLSAGMVDILIATHAALQTDVAFRDLGLIVIDEQHKFGVDQRAALAGKGCPDTLVMTATPIPRSLALTVYGDLEVSTLDEAPPGRKPVRTELVGPERQPAMWDYLRREFCRGRQGYIVSPLVEENEDLNLKSATTAFAELSAGPLTGCRLALLHGQMKRDEQTEIMARFRQGEIDALVCTVVVEVGVDVPNATLMAVLHAERFGLAQLHQLRGRVSRGTEPGWFMLLAEGEGEIARRRLEILTETADGFRIAEEDLKLRGPGQFLGTRQHGLPDFRLIDLSRDLETIRAARAEAAKLLAADPDLRRPEHRGLLRALEKTPGEPGVG